MPLIQRAAWAVHLFVFCGRHRPPGRPRHAAYPALPWRGHAHSSAAPLEADGAAAGGAPPQCAPENRDRIADSPDPGGTRRSHSLRCPSQLGVLGVRVCAHTCTYLHTYILTYTYGCDHVACYILDTCVRTCIHPVYVILVFSTRGVETSSLIGTTGGECAQLGTRKRWGGTRSCSGKYTSPSGSDRLGQISRRRIHILPANLPCCWSPAALHPAPFPPNLHGISAVVLRGVLLLVVVDGMVQLLLSPGGQVCS